MSLIEIEHLTKTLGGNKLLDDVSLCIEDGSFTVLLGANGSGKTSLIKCLTGLYRPDGGTIMVKGLEWNRRNDQQIKRLFSYIPDKANFDGNLNVEQNLLHHAAMYGISQREARAEVSRLFDFFGLTGRQKDYISQYSFGMSKKALIIRGLLTKPRILIFDEPTIGLDYRARTDLVEELMRLNQAGITIVLSTQSLSVAYRAHQVIYIERGRAISVKPAQLAALAVREGMRITTALIPDEQFVSLRSTLMKIMGVYEVEVQSHGVRVELNRDPSSIAQCIQEILSENVMVFEIEFESVSYSSLYSSGVKA